MSFDWVGVGIDCCGNQQETRTTRQFNTAKPFLLLSPSLLSPSAPCRPSQFLLGQLLSSGRVPSNLVLVWRTGSRSVLNCFQEVVNYFPFLLITGRRNAFCIVLKSGF